MKPPFSYYGGKQKIVKHILPLIPKHTVYVEPFCGGATLLFAKPFPDVTNSHYYREVINDHNKRITNFFRVLRDNPDELIRVCSLTPYSQEEHNLARVDTDDPVESARRWFVDTQQSFSSVPGRGWAFSKLGHNHPVTWFIKCSSLIECVTRLVGVYIDCNDALKVIKRWDSPQTFFYCDPPYPNTNQGSYEGYTSEDLNNLVEILDNCQGSFILSNYEQPNIPSHWERFGIQTRMSAARDKSLDTKRTEILWRRLNRVPVKPDIQKLYDSGKYDCFTGSSTVSNKRVVVASDIAASYFSSRWSG